jgi:mRNA-degrading endonuclease RelE of RelBE toxin-antitoxin system
MYKVEWTKQAEEDLNKIDRTIANKIAYRVENYLVQNPQQLGKRLSGV